MMIVKVKACWPVMGARRWFNVGTATDTAQAAALAHNALQEGAEEIEMWAPHRPGTLKLDIERGVYLRTGVFA